MEDIIDLTKETIIDNGSKVVVWEQILNRLMLSQSVTDIDKIVSKFKDNLSEINSKSTLDQYLKILRKELHFHETVINWQDNIRRSAIENKIYNKIPTDM